MSTSVINKLRIQGSSASLGDPSLRRTTQRVSIDACDTPKRFAFHQATNNIGKVRSYNSPNISHPNSAPSRRHSFLQRVQEANRGLTSCESRTFTNDYTQEKNTIHFLLRGKPANGEDDGVQTSSHCPFSNKRVGNYKTTTTEQYRARHRFRDMTDFYEDSSVPSNSMTFGHNDECFYLGPDSFPMSNVMHPRQRPEVNHLPHSAPGGLKNLQSRKNIEKDVVHENKTSSVCESKSIASDRTTVTLADYDIDTKNENTDNDFYESQDTKPGPYPTPIPTKRRQSRSRGCHINYAPSAIPPDPTLLEQCLFVKQPSNLLESETAEEIHRHKKGFRGKVTPARYNSSLNNKSTKLLGSKDNSKKYFFNSVESYVHFNKIYPKPDNISSSSITAKGISSKASKLRAQFPRLEGFSPHCTDTLLLKMMFEMNKPPRSVKSVKSVSKYSDVAVHKDLDEFIVVGTPSLSRSTSMNSPGLGLGASAQSNLKGREKGPEN